MGARVKTISDEMLVSGGVHQLDPELLLTTSQAAMLLGCAVSGMAERKRSGRPPAPRQPDGPGTKVSYLLGEVLDARRSAPAPANSVARKAQQNHIRGFSTFAAFLAEGHLSDQWPFLIVDGRPLDLISSLSISLTAEADCQWLSLGQFIDRLKAAASEQEAVVLTEAMEASTDPAIKRVPSRGERM